MEIRVATEDRMGEIADLLLAAYAEFAPPEHDPLRPSWDEYYTGEIPDVKSRWHFSQHLIAVDGERIVGTATYIPDGSHPDLKSEAWPQGYAAMRLLGVHPDARGRGLGRLLTDECLRRAREADKPWFGLHTTELMKTARSMYERMGFVRFPQNDIPVTEDFVVVAYRLGLT